MRLAVFASLVNSIGLLFVEGAPAPSYKDEAVTSYTVTKCVTNYGSSTTSQLSTVTSWESITFYDATTSTSYPYTSTRTPTASTTYKTNYNTVYITTQTVYLTVPTVTTTSTSVYTTTLLPFVTTSTSTIYSTTTSWVATVSTVSAASNFLPLASHISLSPSATPNTLPLLFATAAITPFPQPVSCFRDTPDLDQTTDLAGETDVALAAAYPTFVQCAALVIYDSTKTVTATGTGTYTKTAPTPIRTSTKTSTVSGTATSTISRGSTTLTRTTSSTYSERTTTTILKSSTSTTTTTSHYASSTFYAACAPNNLVWGVNNIEIPWPTNNGKWKTLYGFKSAYECCVYGIINKYGGSIFETYTGQCDLAIPDGKVCNALEKTFKFFTGCPSSSSWVVSNGNCGQGTWMGKKTSTSGELLEGTDCLPHVEATLQSPGTSVSDVEAALVVDGQQFFEKHAQEQEPITSATTFFADSQQDQPGELKA